MMNLRGLALSGDIRRRCALVVALSLALGGCLSSKRPLYDESAAVTPLAEGHYGAYERGDTIRFKQTDVISIKRSGQGYDFIDGKAHSHHVTLYPYGPKTFIAQAKTDGDDYLYVQMEPRGGTIMIRTADCSKQDTAKLTALGVDVANADCKLDRISDPTAVFSALHYSRSSGKLIRK